MPHWHSSEISYGDAYPVGRWHHANPRSSIEYEPQNAKAKVTRRREFTTHLSSMFSGVDASNSVL